MVPDVSRRVDDLSAQEADAVVRAYEAALLHDDHDEALARAMNVFRSYRPGLPLSIIAVELDILLAYPPRIAAA